MLGFDEIHFGKVSPFCTLETEASNTTLEIKSNYHKPFENLLCSNLFSKDFKIS